jgi:ORF6N domain
MAARSLARESKPRILAQVKSVRERKTKVLPFTMHPSPVPAEQIGRSILVLRSQRVILDRELARIYGVETRILNQAVKRNAERFPDDFRFQLTTAETAGSRSQFVTLKPGRGQNIKFLPYAFTEHGAIMAATILNSPRAVEMSIYVVRAFVQLRELISSNKDLARRLDQLEARIEKRLVTHDDAIAAMLSAIRQLMNAPPPKRRPIGFTANLDEK